MLTDGPAMNLHLGASFSSCVTYTPKCTGIEIAQSTGDGQLPIRVTDPGKDQVLLSLMTCCSFALCTSLLPQRELLLYFLSDSEETQEEPFKHLSVLYLLIGFPGTVSSEGGYFLNGASLESHSGSTAEFSEEWKTDAHLAYACDIDVSSRMQGLVGKEPRRACATALSTTPAANDNAQLLRSCRCHYRP